MELNGHKIVIPPEPRTVMINDVPYRYGIAGDRYYLERHPHDRADTLVGAVRRYLEYVSAQAGTPAGTPARQQERSRRAC